jgi:hypothetical protein
MPGPWIDEAWMILRNEDLRIERRQAREEGKDLSGLEAELDALASLDLDRDLTLQPRAVALLDTIRDLPLRNDFPYQEPDRLEDIRKARPEAGPDINPPALSGDAFFDKMYGAWLGRCCGCLAGKPVEGRRRRSMERILKAQGRWPLSHYWSMKVDHEVAREENWFSDQAAEPSSTVIEGIRCMPEDDDTNYTVAGHALLENHGVDFTPSDVAAYWLGNLSFLHVFTAERAAYRNLVMMIPPPGSANHVDGAPSSATWCNPYREWIGAQIRGDFFGYAAPGRPERAAGWAWRDACISHVKNGIYGEMWVAAMLAAAWTTRDIETIIQAGLAQIPAACRLREAIDTVLAWKKAGLTFDQALDEIHGRWNEADFHDWCHTLSNAQIVAVGLLWGGMDFESSVCRAVTCAFDADCNGATVGSIVGLAMGAKELPEKWTAPLHDTLKTGIHGMHELKISRLARDSCDLVTGKGFAR